MDEFDQRNRLIIGRMAEDRELHDATRTWFARASEHEYSYHFRWLGVPIIQFPQDVMATQEIIWQVQPDLIIETGIARGGSLIFNASLLELIGGSGRVLGIDIDIREHNRRIIESHPLHKRITMIEGSSIAENIVQQVYQHAGSAKKVMVILDSNHTGDHVARELELYSTLVKAGSYLLVFDTVIEDMPEKFSSDRPWGKGNNPKTAVEAFLKLNERFEVDREIETKLQITVAPNGYLRCIKDE